MSQLLLRLRAELQATDDAERQAELLARIAGQLARLGQFDQARQAIAELRAIYGDGRSGRATVWIMLAEGLVHFYSECHALALDRMTRAQVLAIAMKLSDVVAIVSAWKAQIEFETPKYDAMIQSLNIGLTHVSDDDLDAQTRLAIVLSNSFMICGDVDEAQRWFIRGRNYALRNGDQASIEALLYNRAALGITNLRARRCLETGPSGDLKLNRTEVESAKNLQNLTGIAALTNHVHLWSARLSILEGKYGTALTVLRSLRDVPTFAGHNFSQPLIDLEIAYCLYSLGEFDNSLSIFLSVNFSSFGHLDIDEQLVAAWIRWKLSTADGRFGDADAANGQLDALAATYAELGNQLLPKLRDLVARRAPKAAP